MDLPRVPEIYQALICCILLTCCLKIAKMAWNWSFTETLPWFLLNIHQLHHIAIDVMNRFNGTFQCPGIWLGASNFVATVDPANIHYMTTTNFANYPKGDEFRKIFDALGYALFNSDDEDYKHYRRLVHTPIKSRNFFNHSMKTTHAKLEQVLAPLLLKNASEDKDCILDMQDVFQRFALDVTFKSLTGHDPVSLSIDNSPDVPFSGALADFERGIVYRIALPGFLWKLQLIIGFGPETKLSLARGVISRYISQIVSKKRLELSSNTSDGDDEGADLLTLLLLKDPNDNEFLEDMTLQQMIAGRDAISSAMTWFVWLILEHPEVEEKIRNEIRAGIPGAKAEEWCVFDANETSNLVYLHAALTETMRLYPPGPFHYKSPREPDVLPSGHPVNPKTKILIPLYAMARMRAIWGYNCSVFEPERWITEGGTIKHEPSNKFFVFYAGPRSCIGKEAAMTQMKMVAATLIHNFQFELIEGQNIEPDVSMILHMKYGLKMKVYNRWTREYWTHNPPNSQKLCSRSD